MDNSGFACDDLENPKRIEGLQGQYEINEKKIFTFNEAVELTGHGKFHLILLLVCGLCMMAVMTEIMGISLLIPLAKCDLKFTLSEQSFLASSGFLGIVVSSHMMGFLSDTWGRLNVLRLSITISSICSIISAFSINVWMLSALRFFVGFFISSCQACNYSYLGEFHGSKTRTRAVTLLSTFLPLAMIYMPAIAFLILPLQLDWQIWNINFTSWRFFMICNSIPGFIALFALPFFPESPRYLLVHGKQEEAKQVLQLVFTHNTGKPSNNYPVEEISMEILGSNLSSVKTISDGFKLIWSQTIQLFYKERRWNTLNFILHVFIIFALAQGTFMWFPGILNRIVENYHHDITICEAIAIVPLNLVNKTSNTDNIDENCLENIDVFMYEIMIVMGIAYTCIYLFFSFSINFIGKKRLLISWMILAGSCSIALYWSTGFYLNMILLTLMMAIGNCNGIVNTIAMEFFPTNINAMGMCLLVMVSRLGSSAGSSIIGTILVHNCDMFFYGAGIFVFLLIALSGLLPTYK